MKKFNALLLLFTFLILISKINGQDMKILPDGVLIPKGVAVLVPSP